MKREEKAYKIILKNRGLWYDTIYTNYPEKQIARIERKYGIKVETSASKRGYTYTLDYTDWDLKVERKAS